MPNPFIWKSDCFGRNDVPFDDLPAFQSIGGDLTTLNVYRGDVVDNIECIYEGKSAGKHDILKRDKPMAINLNEGDYITEFFDIISSKWPEKEFITRLGFSTKFGKKYGSYGKGVGASSKFTAPEGHQIVGIYGSTGWDKTTPYPGRTYFSSIGFYHLPRIYVFVAKLLTLYHDKSILFPHISINRLRDIKLVKLQSELEQYILNHGSTVDAPEQWWNDTLALRKSEPPEDTLRRAIALLTHYEKVFEAKPLEESITPFGLLALGSRLWKRNNSVVGEYPFPSLRLLRLNALEFDNYLNMLGLHKELPLYSVFKQSAVAVGTHACAQVAPIFTGTRPLAGKQYGLGAAGTNNPQNVIKNVHQWAVKEGLEILILPELCVDDTQLALLKDLLSTESGRMKLVVAGSFYRKHGAETVNEAPVLLITGNDKKIITHSVKKAIPFSMDIDVNSKDPVIKKISEEAQKAGCEVLVEDMEPGSCVAIIKVEGGYLGIAICRDVLDLLERSNPLLRYTDFVDIMLVTSLNSGHTNLFTSSAESMARWHHCATVYANALCAVPDPSDKVVEVSFVLMPTLERVTGIKGEIYYRTAPDVRVSIADAFPFSAVYSKGVVPKAVPNPEGAIKYEIALPRKSVAGDEKIK